MTISDTQAAHCRARGFRVIHADVETYPFTDIDGGRHSGGVRGGVGGGGEGGADVKKTETFAFDVALMMESLSHVRDKEALLSTLRSGNVAETLLIRVNCDRFQGPGESYTMYVNRLFRVVNRLFKGGFPRPPRELHNERISVR